MSRGRKSPAIRLSKIPKNKGHTPAKEHMTSAAEQHGAAASRNACAPRMLYICCRPCTIKWLCTNDGRDRPAKAHPASTSILSVSAAASWVLRPGKFMQHSFPSLSMIYFCTKKKPGDQNPASEVEEIA